MNDLIREGSRWLSQAEDDYRFVEWIRLQDGFHDKICFMSQQAGENILKACLYASGKRKVWGHSLAEMTIELSRISPSFQDLLPPTKRLDRYYIAPNYPNGLPGLCPFQAYTADDSADAWNDLQMIFTHCRPYLAPLLAPGGQGCVCECARE
ncbi:MAG: HEPN domain-containing protein [Thermodesulfobacteriota bacterium]